ncbi:MAG: hypothetical protein NTU88_00980 [Armatimonadetes bacterium]|nr:hypothetical protein [Armatimonadota bacterium]
MHRPPRRGDRESSAAKKQPIALSDGLKVWKEKESFFQVDLLARIVPIPHFRPLTPEFMPNSARKAAKSPAKKQPIALSDGLKVWKEKESFFQVELPARIVPILRFCPHAPRFILALPAPTRNMLRISALRVILGGEKLADAGQKKRPTACAMG